MRDVIRTARDAAIWAMRWYMARFLVVVGISMVPTVERFVRVWYADHLPGVAVVAGEILTNAARVALIVIAVRAMLAEPATAAAPGVNRWRLVGQAIDARPVRFYGQIGVLAIAFAIFDILPNAAVPLVVPDSDQAMVSAVLVAVKNPTVIAFTMLWMVGVVRTLLVEAVRDRTPAAGLARSTD